MPKPRRRPALAVHPLEDRTVPVAGKMDTSFGGGDGIASFGLTGFTSAYANSAVVQPDGKTVLVGLAHAGTQDYSTVLRLSAAGNLDTTFSGDGVYTTLFGGTNCVLIRAALQADGKIVGTGAVQIGSSIVVATIRLNTDGTPDTSFGGTGYVTTDVSASDDWGYDLAVQPDGKIVVGGNAGNSLLFLRYNSNGTLDTGFDGDGIVTMTPNGSPAIIRAVAIQPDGQILGGGSGQPQGMIAHGFLLVRLNPDGSPDTTFDGDGIVGTAIPGTDNCDALDMALLSDNRIVLAGGGLVAGSGEQALALYMPDGSLDNNFDGDGRLLLNYAGNGGGALFGVVAQTDNRIVAGGYGVFPNNSLLLRLNEDGTLDSSFGVGNTLLQPGVVSTDVGSSTDRIFDVAIRPDGRFVTAGNGDGNNTSLAYTGDDIVPVPDSFSTNEGTTLSISVPGVLTNDTILAGSPQVELVQGPSNASSFTLNPDGSFSYTPTANFNGTDKFRYRLVDGSTTTGSVVVSLTVNPVNSAPSAFDDAYPLPRLTPLTLSVAAAQGVLANDTDPEGDTRHALLVTPPAQGTLDLHDDGSFTYDFPMSLNGAVTFTYKVNDGTVDGTTATVTLSRPADLAPIAVDDAYTLPFQSPLIVAAAQGVRANDSDPEADPFTIGLVTGPASGTLDLQPDGSFTFSFAQNFTGQVTFTYRLNDGRTTGNTATVTLTKPPDQPPVALDDSYTVGLASPLVVPQASGVLFNDGDAEGDPILPTLVSQPAVGTVVLNINGSFTYTFPPEFVGSVTFTYKVADATYEGNTATVTLTRQGLLDTTNGTLKILGTGGSDVIRLKMAGTGVVIENQSALGLTRQVVRPAEAKAKFVKIELLLGPGNDRLDATALKLPVRVVGGAGDDVIRTGKGSDTVFGDEADGTGTGADLIETGAGNDTVVAGSGGSFIDVGTGNDVVTVNGGANWVQGGAGNDVLGGGSGNDVLEGGTGKDLLVGGLGADLLDGGAGTDILFDGTLALKNPGTDSLQAILAAYSPSKHASLVAITNRLVVTSDVTHGDTLTGGAGTDWFWSVDGLDVLDVLGTEPKNAVLA